MQSQKPPEAGSRMVVGPINLRRIGRFRFPIAELVGEDGSLAHLGRDSSLSIFFGTGRRVRLADGTKWRIKAATSGRHIVPVLVAPNGTVAVSGPLHAKRSYGINLKDRSYTLIPATRVGMRRPGRWVLRHHEEDIGTIDDRARLLTAAEPIPIGAALMAFTLMTHGIPGEADMMPKRD